eukprot:scaffold762_cov121-Isochrysis_galbana.AAC.1
MAPPSYASALTGDFLAVPPSPKRPREDEQPEVRRTAQSWAWPWPDSNDTIDIRSAVVSLRLHRGTGEPERFTSQNHITICSVERCRTPLSHHGAERACIPQDLAAAMPKVTNTNMTLRLSRLDKTRSLHNIRRHPHTSCQEHSSDVRRNPSDSGSTVRQKGNHARQGNTQLSSSQQRQYAHDPPPHPPDPSGNDG